MSKFVIRGGHQLAGDIPVYGSKNAALPLLAATLLTEDEIILHEIPEISDVDHLISIIAAVGGSCVRKGTTVRISVPKVSLEDMPHELVGKLRGSILMMGAFLGRVRRVSLPSPGGDVIGARPIDVHLDAFEQLGATVARQEHLVIVDGTAMKAGDVTLREASVTATENVMLVAATLPGTTTIRIAAQEPHIVVLGELLEKMGATVKGAGTHTITITGTSALRGAEHTNIPDMLEAGFFILLGAVTQSALRVTNVPTEYLTSFFKKLDDIGIHYSIDGTTVTVTPAPLRGFKVQTLPYPGVATDLQAPFAVVATQAVGSSLIHDPMYESRFRHCDELKKMGAGITVCDPHRVIIEGPRRLHGNYIQSLDIRSGATLIMAGLVANGQTTIEDAEILDRGYARLLERLRAIKADISRVA